MTSRQTSGYLRAPLRRESTTFTCDAPSVRAPEIAIPSAGTNCMPLSRVFVSATVRLPESFRGGCSFGTNVVGSPDVDLAPLLPR